MRKKKKFILTGIIAIIIITAIVLPPIRQEINYCSKKWWWNIWLIWETTNTDLINCPGVINTVCWSDQKEYNNNCEACRNQEIKRYTDWKCWEKTKISLLKRILN